MKKLPKGKLQLPGQPFKAPASAGVNGNPKNAHPVKNTTGSTKIKGK